MISSLSVWLTNYSSSEMTWRWRVGETTGETELRNEKWAEQDFFARLAWPGRAWVSCLPVQSPQPPTSYYALQYLLLAPGSTDHSTDSCNSFAYFRDQQTNRSELFGEMEYMERVEIIYWSDFFVSKKLFFNNELLLSIFYLDKWFRSVLTDDTVL